jgi:electron transfer flavoprotein alpha subunit
METILFLAHVESDGTLSKHALEALASAIALRATIPGSALVAGLSGEKTQDAANAIASCGASQFLAVDGAAFSTPRYSTDSLAAESLAKACGASIVVAAATPRWNRVLPGAAHRLQGRTDTHVTGLAVQDGAIQISRWYYRQRMEAIMQRTQRPWFILLEPGCAKPWTGASGTATVDAIAAVAAESHKRTVVTGIQSPALDRQTIRPESPMLFVTGAGWTKKQADGKPHVKEAESLILGFLDKTRASLGSSKSLVDLSGEGQDVLSFLTHLNQIGQTGSTPRHQKGLATCCHGEEPHSVGWRFIQERRAINLDPNCGWARGKADVLYVADAFQVMAKVNALL